nr:probable fructose-2,6-bisphosphatase TIGAR A isoform X3 [Nothobranchius furzeri]
MRHRDVCRFAAGVFAQTHLTSDRSMKALTLALTLVRHGETTYNKDGLLQGQAIDSALSETGLQQAEAAGFYLKDVKFSHVFVSDMLRARQTAERIVQLNRSCLGLQMVCDPLLKEKSFGIAEGGRVEDVKEMARAAGESFPDFTPPEGESQEQFPFGLNRFCRTSKILTHPGHDLLRVLGANSWTFLITLKTFCHPRSLFSSQTLVVRTRLVSCRGALTPHLQYLMLKNQTNVQPCAKIASPQRE